MATSTHRPTSPRRRRVRPSAPGSSGARSRAVRNSRSPAAAPASPRRFIGLHEAQPVGWRRNDPVAVVEILGGMPDAGLLPIASTAVIRPFSARRAGEASCLICTTMSLGGSPVSWNSAEPTTGRNSVGSLTRCSRWSFRSELFGQNLSVNLMPHSAGRPSSCQAARPLGSV